MLRSFTSIGDSYGFWLGKFSHVAFDSETICTPLWDTLFSEYSAHRIAYQFESLRYISACSLRSRHPVEEGRDRGFERGESGEVCHYPSRGHGRVKSRYRIRHLYDRLDTVGMRDDALDHAIDTCLSVLGSEHAWTTPLGHLDENRIHAMEDIEEYLATEVGTRRAPLWSHCAMRLP